MAIKNCNSLSLHFLAAAAAFILVAAGKGADAVLPPRDLCKDTDYQPLCRSVLKGITSPEQATQAFINATIHETALAKDVVKRLGKSKELDTCHDSFVYAISSLKNALRNLNEHDRLALNTNLNAAVTNYAACDDVYAELGQISPFANNTKTLRHMTSNCIALAILVD
ncbi:Pectinesterase inhibitor [Melia azedarach]|uniref:Pectinesterase inhibitor n=1 Tax=Melia azedarach TaxID=155640 RepID=A0ACC1XIE7_MELAZ|nr:Pectinesterase inhibitor [Melia azedarach]